MVATPRNHHKPLICMRNRRLGQGIFVFHGFAAVETARPIDHMQAQGKLANGGRFSLFREAFKPS
jgi:hypothetical protein